MEDEEVEEESEGDEEEHGVDDDEHDPEPHARVDVQDRVVDCTMHT